MFPPHSFAPPDGGFGAAGLGSSGLHEASQNLGESHNPAGPPKRDSRPGGRNKARGRSERGRGRDTKLVYAVSQGHDMTGKAF